jgi:hypothetical protein
MISYGRQGPLGPRLHFRTPRDGFPITGLLSTRASVIGTPLGAITHPRSLTHAQSELTFVQSSLRFVQRVSQDLDSFCPCVFSCTDPTSAYPEHYPRYWLLRASYSTVTCGWLPAPA